MDVQVTALGAIIGLVIAILLIFVKVPPVYGLFAGALIGGLIGGASLPQTVQLMMDGAAGMMTAVLRILAAGILAGVLIQTGAANSIAQTIIKAIGQTKALFALVIATMILALVGVFIDIAVITVAPIALVIAKQSKFSRSSILLAMIGGGKAGNIISPNPNTIAVSDAFREPLTSVMLAGAIPAIFAVLITYFLAKRIINKGSMISDQEVREFDSNESLPSFAVSISGPLVAILLLALRPLFNIEVDPMIALPIGGIVGSISAGKAKNLVDQMNYGLSKMSGVAILLIGTGTIAGIITNSTLGDALLNMINGLGLPIYILAPLSGIVMSAATASTTSGATVAAQVFSGTLVNSGFSPLGGAAMIHAGSTVLDHLPHGSFFHATAGSVQMKFNERLKLIGYETLVGLTITVISVMIFGVFGIG